MLNPDRVPKVRGKTTEQLVSTARTAASGDFFVFCLTASPNFITHTGPFGCAQPFANVLRTHRLYAEL